MFGRGCTLYSLPTPQQGTRQTRGITTEPWCQQARGPDSDFCCPGFHSPEQLGLHPLREGGRGCTQPQWGVANTAPWQQYCLPSLEGKYQQWEVKQKASMSSQESSREKPSRKMGSGTCLILISSAWWNSKTKQCYALVLGCYVALYKLQTTLLLQHSRSS